MILRLSCAALLLASAGGAAEEGPEVLPPWIVVEALLRPDTPPVRASAVLPADAWAGRGIGTLAEAFRHIPGAMMQESFGGFEPPRLSIRGSGVQSAPTSRGVTLLLNQLPLGLADGSFNSALLDPLLSSRIEVQRGIDGWRASPAVAGGALDFRRHAAGGRPAAGRVETGSFGTLRASGAAAASRDRTRAGAGFSYARQDGFREHSGQARTAVDATLVRTIDHHAQAGIELYHARARYDVPGPLTWAAARAAPRSVSADVGRDRPARRAETTRLAGTYVRSDPVWEVELGAALGRTADDFRQLQPNGVTISRSDDAFLRATAARRFMIGGTPHQLRVLGTAARGWREQARYVNEGGVTGQAFGRDGLFPTTVVAQVEDAFALPGRVVATAGVSRVTARREIIDRHGIGPSSARRIFSGATLPAASLRWRLKPDLVVFASASSVAEPPTFDDLLVTGGTHPSLVRRSQELATQRAVTWEIGARGRSARVAWDAAVYRSAWRNEILRLADARGLPRGAVNASPTAHAGVEASARWLVYEGPVRVMLATTAVWTHVAFAGDPVYGRNRLAGLPPHVGTADLTVELRRGGFAAIGTDWTAGATRVDHAGRLAYGGQARTHLRAGRRVGENWTGFAEVRNVFDRAGIASTAGVLDLARNPAATSIFLPATGRAFVLGLQWRP
jgi:iron complex outermembrane recepter protein